MDAERPAARIDCYLSPYGLDDCQASSKAEQRHEITTAVHDVQNQHYVLLYDTMDDDVVVSRESA